MNIINYKAKFPLDSRISTSNIFAYECLSGEFVLIELITSVLFPQIFIGSKKQGLIVTNLKALFWKKSNNSTLENGESFTAQ